MSEHILQSVIANFNFAYMITVNILTYIIINIIDIANGKAVVTFWQKRIVLLVSIVAIGIVYYYAPEVNFTTIVNSAIAAPVFWSWVLKPILTKCGIDYQSIDNTLK